MAKFRKKPDISFRRKRSVSPAGVTPGKKIPADRNFFLPNDPAYADTSVPLPRDVADAMKEADDTFVNLAGVLSKANQVMAVAEILPKALYIPVDPNASLVRSAVLRRDRRNSPDGDKIYWGLFKQAIDQALNQFKFVNLEFVSKLSGEQFTDSNLYNINWTANNVGTIPPANGSVEGSASTPESTPGAAVLKSALKKHDVPFIAKVLSLGAPILMLWLAAQLVKPFQTPSDQARVGPKQPAGAEWPAILIQITIGIAIYILLHGLTKEEARRSFGMLRVPGLKDEDLDRCIDDAYAISTGGQSSDGKTLKDYPLGVPEEFLTAAMAQMGSGDWEIIREYAVAWLVNNIHDDRYFAWHVYMDSKMVGHDLEAALDTAPYYSPLFRRQANAVGKTVKNSGGYFPRTSQPSSFDRQFQMREGAKNAGADIVETAGTGLVASPVDLYDFSDLDSKADRDWAKSKSDGFNNALNDNPTEDIFNKGASYPDDRVQKLGKYRNFLDQLSRICNETLEDLMALMAQNNWVKEFICCFARWAVMCNPSILKDLKTLLKWLGTKLEYDLGAVLKKLYDKYWTNLVNELKLNVHATLDEEWQRMLKANVEPLMNNKDVLEFGRYCHLLDMFIQVILQALAQFKARIDALIDEMFEGLILNSDLFNLKIKLWVPCREMQLMAKILDIVINFVNECGVPETTEEMGALEKILKSNNAEFLADPSAGVPDMVSGTLDGIRGGLSLDDAWKRSYDIIFDGANGAPPVGQADVDREHRFHNKLVVYGQEMTLPAEYNKATPNNSWWYGKPKEFEGGFILMPYSAILEGKLNDEKIAEEQKNRCRDFWSPDMIKSISAGLPSAARNSRTQDLQFEV